MVREAAPALLKAWDEAPDSESAESETRAEQIALLRKWDLRWAVNSVPTSLAVFWGEDVRRRRGRRRDAARALRRTSTIAKAPAEQLLQSLAAASDKLAADFGSWKTPWGDINRFQRLTGDIVQPFNDAGPSIPVGFHVRDVGIAGVVRRARVSGNEEVVRHQRQQLRRGGRVRRPVRARAVTAGGESGNPASPHFNDQAKRYSTGDLREVYFYRAQLKGHTEREYHP